MKPLKPLIVFSGPDGAGKTTLAKMITAIISRRSSVKIVRIRGTHTAAYLMMTFLRLFKGFKGRGLHYYGVRLPENMKGVWLWIELLSVAPLVILYYYLYRLRYTVISERGPFDLLIWLLTGLDLETTELSKRLPLRIILSWVMKFNTIYVRADKDILLSRKPEEHFLIEQSFELGESLARNLDLTFVDTTNKSPREYSKFIVQVFLSENKHV